VLTNVPTVHFVVSEARVSKLHTRLTGARRANVQAMRWEEINWQALTWRIPETKSGEPVTLPLSPQAVAILENRKAGSKSEWVFPSTGATGHLVEPKTAWKRILKNAATIQVKNWLRANRGKSEADFAKEFPNAGFQDLRIHDLRRTLCCSCRWPLA
jgi:integrase